MKRLSALVILGAAFAAAHGQGDTATVQKIIDEGKNHSQTVQILKDITSKFGSRLTSSTHLEKAQKWAMDQFRKYGCTNVHLEQWGEFPVGFDRGMKCYGRMVSPEKLDFQFTTPSWLPGTKGPLKAKGVKAPVTMADLDANKDKLKGAWVVYTTVPPPRVPVARPGQPAPEITEELKARLAVEKALDDLGIAGRVSASTSDRVVTPNGNWRIDPANLPTEHRIIVRKSDMDKIAADLDANKDVVLEFNLDQKFVKGPRPQFDVVAEIKGTEKPDEVVIVSGHFDSWDGPGSQGALDNGVGSAVTLEAARLLCKSGAKPKRTIRFILWSGEEQGIFGSQGYVALHANEMDKVSAVLVDDGGTNYQGGYEGIATQKDMMETAFAPMNAAFPDMPEKFVTRDQMPRGGGSDHASFNAIGVPGFFTIETGRSDYGFVHHTQNDRFEMAIPEYLVQSGTNHAVVSFNLACADTMLPRGPKPERMPDISRIPGLDKLLGKG